MPAASLPSNVSSGADGTVRSTRRTRTRRTIHTEPLTRPSLRPPNRIQFTVDKELSQEQTQRFVASIHDKMTECVYAEPLQSFETNIKPEVWRRVVGRVAPCRMRG